MLITRPLRALAFASLIGALIGCAQVPTLVSDVQWAQAVKVSRDPFTLYTTIQGGMIETAGSTTFLRSVRSDKFPNQDGLVVYSIVKTKEWKFIDKAFAISLGQIPISVLDRDIRYCNRYGCALAEHVAIPTTRDFLMRYIDTGLDIKLTGKRGEEQIFLPPAYIVAFLASLPSKEAHKT